MSLPTVVIKIVVFSVTRGQLKILLKNNSLVVSGLTGEHELDMVAQKTCESVIGIPLETKHLEQLYTVSRKSGIDIIYFILIPESEIPPSLLNSFLKPPVNNRSPDKEIINYAVQRIRWKIEYTNAVYSLLPGEFTLSDLQTVYEAILGKELDKRNFRKKILSLNIIKATGHLKKLGQSRPAEMFAFRKKELTFVKVL